MKNKRQFHEYPLKSRVSMTLYYNERNLKSGCYNSKLLFFLEIKLEFVNKIS